MDAIRELAARRKSAGAMGEGDGPGNEAGGMQLRDRDTEMWQAAADNKAEAEGWSGGDCNKPKTTCALEAPVALRTVKVFSQ